MLACNRFVFVLALVLAVLLMAESSSRAQTSMWEVADDFQIELVGSGYRLPVNIAFVPNPDPGPDSPLYYVAELYGSIKVVKRSGAISTFATGLLDYNPEGPIGGSGEQGMAGLAVERSKSNPAIYHLYVTMLWDNGNPPSSVVHYPKVERIDSAPGGLTMATRTVLRNMQPETQGQAHMISNISIGPDDKLYVHMGDGFFAATGLDLNSWRGKILRMNKDGSAVATNDPAGGNPFYDASNGITARDYVFTYGHRNPFGGAWLHSTNEHFVVENGNGLDRMVSLSSGASYGWDGTDASLANNALYVWSPAVAPVNIDFIQPTVHNNSGFPAQYSGRAYVTQSGSTYANGPGTSTRKVIAEYIGLEKSARGVSSLGTEPRTIVRYIGTGRSSVVAIAAGPDGLYFSDFFEESGTNGATAPGSRIYRLYYRPQCLADIAPPGGDQSVGVPDLLAVIGAWGSQGGVADIAPPGGDGSVGVPDLLAIIGNWGNCN